MVPKVNTSAAINIANTQPLLMTVPIRGATCPVGFIKAPSLLDFEKRKHWFLKFRVFKIITNVISSRANTQRVSRLLERDSGVSFGRKRIRMRKPFFENFRLSATWPSLRFFILRAAFWFCVSFGGFFAVSYLSVEIAAIGRTYHDVASVPKNSVGLVLGTSSKLANGTKNAYFTLRMEAASQLYKEKKVDCLLVS